jgi:hypothetical protein
MATIEYWIQIENHAWDVAPNNIDRMTGQDMSAIPGGAAPVDKVLVSPVTGVSRMRTMFKPLPEDALILRRYTENWAAPDDRKVNPWDLNEPDPTDNGTMGTIPGPVIECTVGDTVVVHFRNRDTRADKALESRTHSLHPHGFVFATQSDGAYPLSPPDPTQPVGSEAPAWTSVAVGALKQGDRMPPMARSSIPGTPSAGRRPPASGCITTTPSAIWTTCGLAPSGSSSSTTPTIPTMSFPHRCRVIRRSGHR